MAKSTLSIEHQQAVWRMSEEHKQLFFGKIGSMTLQFDIFLDFNHDYNQIPIKHKSKMDYVVYQISRFCNEKGYIMDASLISILAPTVINNRNHTKSLKSLPN